MFIAFQDVELHHGRADGPSIEPLEESFTGDFHTVNNNIEAGNARRPGEISSRSSLGGFVGKRIRFIFSIKGEKIFYPAYE